MKSNNSSENNNIYVKKLKEIIASGKRIGDSVIYEPQIMETTNEDKSSNAKEIDNKNSD